MLRNCLSGVGAATTLKLGEVVPAAAAVLEGFPRERQSCSLLRGGAVREAEGSLDRKSVV